MTDAIVAKLTTVDRPAWEVLFQAYAEFYGTRIDRPVLDRDWDAFERDETMHAFGACVDDRLVGIVHFLKHASTNGPDVCYIQDLYVLPDARGQGVARALIDAVVQIARQQHCRRVYWVTHETNTTARALYDKVATKDGFIRYQIGL